MKRALACTTLALAVTAAVAAPPGFITDFSRARREAKATGKYIFVYFHLSG